VTQLAAEVQVRSVRSRSEAALEALSRRADVAEEQLSGQAGEVSALRAFGDSAQKDSALALERLSRGEADMARLAAEVAELRGHSEGAHKQLTAHEEKLGGLDRMEAEITCIASEVAALKHWTDACYSLMLFSPKLDSLIIAQFPPLFEEFRGKRFNLLWRGSRDGFGAEEFHLRCYGRANTLTLIVDTDGNVFGGFTPVKWENSCGYESDDSLRSFLFTPRNPHCVPPREFALKAERKQYAICCYSARCAVFGGSGCDIIVYDNCNANRNSCTRIGTRWSDRTYANDTAFEVFLTCAEYFTVKEIEVFEIAD
jgi:hypothetical protein